MKINVKMRKSDYVRFYKEFYIKELTNKMPRILVISFIIGLLLSYQTSFEQGAYFAIGICTIFIIIILLFLFYKIFELSKYPYLNNSPYYDEKIIDIFDNKIVIEVSNGSIENRVISNLRVLSTKSFLCFIIEKNKSVIIPKDQINGESLELIQGVSSNTNNGTITKKTPPYYLIFLSIIPMLGLFVGIYMIYIGLRIYKSRALIFLGVLSILITLTIYLTVYNINYDAFF